LLKISSKPAEAFTKLYLPLNNINSILSEASYINLVTFYNTQQRGEGKMKKTLTGLAIVLVAALWMTGSWVFFNSIAIGAENMPAAPPATTENPPQMSMPPGQMGHCHYHHGYKNFWKKLNLTPTQKKQIKAIRTQERPKMQPLIKQLKAGREQLAELRKTSKFDEAKVRAVADEQAKTLRNVIVERERVMYQIREILTPEQRAKLDEMHKMWKDKKGRKD
jgi:Spy/CpxP family protein refolding chaperone